MTSHSAPISQDDGRYIHINPRLLIAIYSVVPLGLTLLILDIILGGKIKLALPQDPGNFLLFTLFFTLPHILASFFSFFEKAYIKYYSKKLINGLRLVAVASVVLPIISIQLTFYVFAVFTMIHVFFQQSGIAKSIMRGANNYHAYWQWLGAIIAAILYIQIYSSSAGVIPKFEAPKWLLFGLLIIFTILAVKAVTASRTRAGVYYFWLTYSLPVVSMVFILRGYPILAIVIPRLVHDLSAFVFYITHDHNRYVATGGNRVYEFFHRLKIPVMFASPLLAIGLTYPLHLGRNFQAVFIALMFIFLSHYYIESFVWKKQSLHRQYILFR